PSDPDPAATPDHTTTPSPTGASATTTTPTAAAAAAAVAASTASAGEPLLSPLPSPAATAAGKEPRGQVHSHQQDPEGSSSTAITPQSSGIAASDQDLPAGRGRKQQQQQARQQSSSKPAPVPAGSCQPQRPSRPSRSSTSMSVTSSSETSSPTPASSRSSLGIKPSHTAATGGSDVDAAKASLAQSRHEDGTATTMANMSSKRQNGHTPTLVSAEPATNGVIHEDTGPTDVPSRGARALLRGSSVSGSALETVQEGVDYTASSAEAGAEPKSQLPAGAGQKADKESGSDSGGQANQSRIEERRSSKQRLSSTRRKPGDIISKRSFASLPPSKGRSGDATPRNMIVEAETVSSVPQVSLGVGQCDRDRNTPTRADAGGIVRLKASDETIRPKKKDKKPSKASRVVPAASGEHRCPSCTLRVEDVGRKRLSLQI
ncbi:hypothetical protein KEM52_002884, partial [Ascosphaera acerosa]